MEIINYIFSNWSYVKSYRCIIKKVILIIMKCLFSTYSIFLIIYNNNHYKLILLTKFPIYHTNSFEQINRYNWMKTHVIFSILTKQTSVET